MLSGTSSALLCRMPGESVITSRGGSRRPIPACGSARFRLGDKRNCACFQNIADGLLLRQDQPAFRCGGVDRHDQHDCVIRRKQVSQP